MKTTNRQVENTIKLHAAKEPSCGKRSDSDNEFVVQRFVGNGNVVTRIGSRKAMSAIPENRENGNDKCILFISAQERRYCTTNPPYNQAR